NMPSVPVPTTSSASFPTSRRSCRSWNVCARSQAMSESRILVIDSDEVRAERTVALLEFMDFTPRWVTDAADIDVKRYRPNDWLAVVVGHLDDTASAEPFFTWLAQAAMPPPVLLGEGDPLAFARHYSLHEA